MALIRTETDIESPCVVNALVGDDHLSGERFLFGDVNLREWHGRGERREIWGVCADALNMVVKCQCRAIGGTEETWLLRNPS